MNLLELAEFLEAQELDLRVTGTMKNLFLTHMPAQVTRGVLLRENAPGPMVDHEIPRYYRASFQVVVRHDDYPKGRKMAEDISAALTMHEVTIGSMLFHYSRPRHLPFVFPASQGDLLEFSVNFDACYVSAL